MKLKKINVIFDITIFMLYYVNVTRYITIMEK